MQAKSLTVVAIDAGETDRAVQRFFATLPVPFPILLDRDRAIARAWRVDVLPTTFVLDGNLIPRFVADGDIDWSRPEVERALTSLFALEAVDAKPRRVLRDLDLTKSSTKDLNSTRSNDDVRGPT